MSNIIFDIPLYFTGITTYIYIYIYIYTELAPKLTAMASVAQSAERWSRDPGLRVQFSAGGLGVALFATGPCWAIIIVYTLTQLLHFFQLDYSARYQVYY